MTDSPDLGDLSVAQQAVMAAWPAFVAEAAIISWSLDRMIRAMYRVDSLAELSDEDAEELADLLATATSRLRLLSDRARRQPRHQAAGLA